MDSTKKLHQSLIDCIEQHKLTFFVVDTAERLKYYMMFSVKKPVRWTICQHICRMETLNKYLGMLPRPELLLALYFHL